MNHNITIDSLYKEDRGAVRKELLNYTNDYDVVDDLEAETFLVAVRDISNWNPKRATLLTWVVNIAKQVGVDHLRREDADKRAYEVLSGCIDDVQDEGYAVEYYDRTDLSLELADQSWNLDPAREAEAEDAWGAALSEMPHTMAAILQMRRDGYSNPEIAETLDKSEGYVRKLVSESRKFFDEGNNSQFNTDNKLCERDAKPTEGRLAEQADVERAQRDRFARRDSAFVKRQIRMDNLDAFLSQWKDMYDGTS